MKNTRILTVVLLSMIAFGGLTASQSFATPKFLLNGAEIKELISAKSEQEMALEDMGAAGKPEDLCSWISDYAILPVIGWLVVEAYLMLDETLLESSIPFFDAVECVPHSICSNPSEVMARSLPWETEIVLIGSSYVLLVLSTEGKVPGFTIDCNTILGLIEDTCTGPTGAILANESGGVLVEYSETNEEITAPGNCTQGGEKQGLIHGVGLITSPSGTLSVSE